MTGCEVCGVRLAPSAEFCPNCGEEGAGYAHRRLRGPSAHPVPLFDPATGRAHATVPLLLGGAAAALAALPWLTGSFGAPAHRTAATFVSGLAILALARRARGSIAGLLATGPAIAWAAGLLGAATFLAAGLPGLTGLPPFLRPPRIAPPALHPVAAGLTLAILPAVLGEVAYRGLLLEGLRGILGGWAAHALTATSFASLYCRPEALPHLLLFALFLGLLREQSRTLLPGMAAHAAYNFGLVFLPAA